MTAESSTATTAIGAARLNLARQNSGFFNGVQFNAGGLAAVACFYRAQVGGQTQTRAMMLLRGEADERGVDWVNV